MSVFVSENIKCKHPNFAKLFDEVQGKCSNDALNTEKSKLWLAKSEWLEGAVILSIVDNVMKEAQIKILNKEMDEKIQKCWEAVQQCLTVSRCCASTTDDQSSTILHLSKENFNNFLADKQAELTKGKRLLADEVEKKLLVYCIKLTSTRDGSDTADNAKIQQAKASQIGEILKQDKFELVSNRERLKDLLAREMNTRDQYHKELQECSSILINLITKYCLRLHPHKDHTVVKNMIVSCQTLSSKLKSIRMELTCETYTPKELEALKKLKAELLESIERQKLESADTEEQLRIYQCLGQDFEDVAAEYGKTKSDIEKQEWTLNELKMKLKSEP